MNVQMLSIFGEDTLFVPSVHHIGPKKRNVSKVIKPLENEHFRKALFPQDYSLEEHLDDLMSTDVFAWCEEDVHDFQVRLAADVTQILQRSNSSKDAVLECLTWIFHSDPNYEFSIHQCAARAECSVEFFQNKYVNILACTLRSLRKNHAKKDKIDFYRACLMKANQLMEDFTN